MNIQYRPLPAVWPSGARTPIDDRRWGTFKAGWPATLELLERELRHLGVYPGDQVTIEAGYQTWEIRQDGMPRANAKPNDPAVIVSFQSNHGPLRYGCDTYRRHEANVRAIALALEALRAVDRYGVLKRGEQYVGNQGLPAIGETSMTTHEARAFINAQAAGTATGPDLQAAYRAAAKRLNPDVPGGDRALWDQLQRAKTAVGL